jgi:hypothetical protein
MWSTWSWLAVAVVVVDMAMVAAAVVGYWLDLLVSLLVLNCG